MLILLTQIAWIPFWAAGVINGVGHCFGYRSWDVPAPDASRNIVPIGMLIGGEELHNNHHAFPASATLLDQVVRVRPRLDATSALLETLGLATVKKVAPKPRFAEPKPAADYDTLHAVIANRYDVLSRYATSMKRTYAEELAAAAPLVAGRRRGAALAEARAAARPGARRRREARSSPRR